MSNPISNTQSSPHWGRNWIEKGILAMLVLAAAVCVTPNSADPDLWGHVQYGRDLIQDGLPATATYTYTSDGFRWINHENLAELTFAVVADVGGAHGLLLLKALLGVGVLALVLWRAHARGVGMLAASMAIVLVGMNLTYFWSVRPQVFSYVFFALVIALLDWCFEGWEGRWNLPVLRSDDKPVDIEYQPHRIRCLWLAAPLFFIWANTHGGFVAGWCVFTAYLVLRGVEAAWARGWEASGMLRRLAMMSLAAGLATLINPYGFHLHLWLLDSLGAPRPEISEWAAPNLTDPVMLPWWLMLSLLAVVSAATRRSRDFTHLVIIALVSWQALEHLRHIAFAALLFGFWMPPHLDSLLRRLKIVSDDSLGADISPSMWRLFAGGLAVGVLLLAVKLYGRLNDLPVERERWPVTAVQWMADEDLEGKLVVRFEWAQYAIAALGSEDPRRGIQVAFDGRFRTCYPQEIVDMLFDFQLGDTPPEERYRSKNSPPIEPARILRFGRPDLALVGRKQAESRQAIEAEGKWTLLYRDETAELWGLSAKYDDPASPDYLPAKRRQLEDRPQVGSVTWPALPVRREGQLWADQRLQRPNALVQSSPAS